MDAQPQVNGKQFSDLHKNRKLIWSAMLLCFVGFAIVSMLVVSNNIKAFDHMISSWVQSDKAEVLDRGAQIFATVAEPNVVMTSALVIAILWMAGVAVFHKNKLKTVAPSLALFVAVNCLAGISEIVLKHLFHRPRPILHISSYSFPSGHAMLSFAFCITASYLLWRHIDSNVCRKITLSVCILITGLVGLSRIYQNVHYPSDVIAGFFASGIILSVGVLLLEQFGNSSKQQY